MSTRSGWETDADFRNENTLHAVVFVWMNIVWDTAESLDAILARSF